MTTTHFGLLFDNKKGGYVYEFWDKIPMATFVCLFSTLGYKASKYKTSLMEGL